MGYNCGDNEYNITVDNNGNCEPTTPIYNITLANVGVNGYSPIVRFINETVESFNIAVDNITGTETSPAVPKLSYVADLINNINTTIAGLGSTYLTKDGSNAANPISLNGLTIREQYGNLYISSNTLVSFSSNANPISIGGSSIDLTSTNTGRIRLLPSNGVILEGAENKNINLTTSGTGKATYNYQEIATVNQIPTVGNGTITITQGGVTKGTFTTNQSGNSTIEIDEGGSNLTAGNGIDITNDVISVDESDLDFLENTATGNLSLTVGGNASDEPYTTNVGNNSSAGYGGATAIGQSALANGYNCTAIGYQSACWGGDYNLAIGWDANAGNPNTNVNFAYQIGTGYNLTSNSLAVGYQDSNWDYVNYQLLDLVTGKIPAARIPIDGTTITVNNSGQLQSSGGGSSYTAGTGIDITNDTISVDSTILTTNTAQTVTGDKTFSADIHLNGGNIELDATSSYIRGKVGGNVYRNIIARSVGASEIAIGNRGDILKLAGSLPYPKYNNVDMALLTDIPTVNNSTITFTQGGVTKGTITLNQSSNATIALDAGGSGGGAVDSVNGQTGTVVLTASDVGALPSSTVIPTKTSDLTNDSGFITNSALSGYATETWVGQQGYITSSALSDYVNKTTDQTVTGVITFDNGIQTYEINNPDGDNVLSNLNNNTSVGDINSTINLYGNTTRPKYYDSQYNTPVDLALSSDIPTVNNPTITFTQGGTTKGTITLNQSSNQTIALDAGGGGGATIDDNTPSTTTVYSSQKTQDLIDALVARIIALEANINGGNA